MNGIMKYRNWNICCYSGKSIRPQFWQQFRKKTQYSN